MENLKKPIRLRQCNSPACAFLIVLFAHLSVQGTEPNIEDFRYAPPEWQTETCPPDDPHKILVDRSGELLYHYGQDGREFATRVGVEVAEGSTWQKQGLLSSRAPIVQTFRSAGQLLIREEAFAITDLPQSQTAHPPSILHRIDSGGMNRNWAKLPTGIDPTPFGELHMKLEVGKDGKVLALKGNRLSANCKAIIVHLPDGSTRRFAAREPVECVFNQK